MGCICKKNQPTSWAFASHSLLSLLYRNKLHAIDSKPDNDFGAQLDDFHHDHHEGFENDFPNGDSLGDDKNFEVIPKKVKQKRRKKLKGSVSLVMES